MLQQLDNETDVEAVLSAPGPMWLFKHSNACGVSKNALDEVERFLAAQPEQKLGLLVIQKHRPLSNLVSNRLKYVHQSPQIFLLDQGQVKWSATHWGITAEAMAAALTTAN
jgi:bacillithiol system protein YtxJ